MSFCKGLGEPEKCCSVIINVGTVSRTSQQFLAPERHYIQFTGLKLGCGLQIWFCAGARSSFPIEKHGERPLPVVTWWLGNAVEHGDGGKQLVIMISAGSTTSKLDRCINFFASHHPQRSLISSWSPSSVFEFVIMPLNSKLNPCAPLTTNNTLPQFARSAFPCLPQVL